MRSTYILAFLVALTVVAATNYCSKSLCPFGKVHVACKGRREFAASCPSNARLVDFKPHIGTILEMHNDRRNRIAGGGLKGYKPAARMATMQWDDELASLAALNVMQCEMKHDECSNTDDFKSAGQNLAIGYGGISDTDMISSVIEMWFDEYKDCNMNIINRYPESYSGPKIGHFTTMVIDSNTHIGCAATRYSKEHKQYYVLACNYARNNLLGEPIYQASSRPASECESGPHRVFKHLCSTAEVYTEVY